MMREREKKAILERETAPLFFRNRSKKKIRLTCALSLSLSLSLSHTASVIDLDSELVDNKQPMRRLLFFSLSRKKSSASKRFPCAQQQKSKDEKKGV